MRLNSPLRSFVLLTAALGACLGLLAVRFAITGQVSHLFLVKNLLLGLLPLAFALVALFVERQNWRGGVILLVFFSALWLVFFPNSSYIFTDFIHLIQRGLGTDNPNARGVDNLLVWFDVINRSLFAFVGHFIGLASLYVMHNLWRKEFGAWVGWLAVGASCWAAGYGVFLGRFVRMSSWHFFVEPAKSWRLLTDNLPTLDSWLFSLAFGTFLAVSYFFVYVFKKHFFASKEPL